MSTTNPKDQVISASCAAQDGLTALFRFKGRILGGFVIHACEAGAVDKTPAADAIGSAAGTTRSWVRLVIF